MAQLSSAYVVACISAGFTDTQIAQACGITSSAVAQYIDAHDLRSQAKVSQKHKETDDVLDSIEFNAATKLKNLLTYEQNIMKVAQVLKIANGCRRRSHGEGANTFNPQTAVLVQLNLPAHVQAEFVRTPNNEIVGVGETPLSTLPAGKLLEHAKETRNEQAAQLNKPAANPGSSKDVTNAELAALL